MKHIYLDNAATTSIDPEVFKAMTAVMNESLGNSSSAHYFGRQARQLIDYARVNIAGLIHAKEKEIIFTSGGTEADNLALIGIARANKHKGKHIITTATEHHAVLNTLGFLEDNGFTVTYLQPNETGNISAQQITEALTDETILVSVMYVNNETGVVQDIKGIAISLKDHQAYFHTDAVQAFGVKDIDVTALGVDLLSMSAHKINGPQGVGFLYCKETVMIKSTQFGGEQERKRRAGTENVMGVIGLEKALEITVNNRTEMIEYYQALYDLFIAQFNESSIKYHINGNRLEATPTIVNISFPNTQTEQLLMNFDISGIAASSGSACTAGTEKPSHVLVSMFGNEDARKSNSIRFSFGKFNTTEEIQLAGKQIAKIVHRLQTR